MKEFFLKDSVLKIISFVIAILLWCYVIIVVDPSVTVTIDEIPVIPLNSNALENNNLTLIDSGKMYVELEIKGSRKKIVNIDSDNIVATINLETIAEKGTYSLPINIKVPYEYEEIVKKTPSSVSVRVDEVVTEEKKINVKKKGSVANGYIAEDYVLKHEKVTLTGAESVMATIKDVEVVLDYADRTSTISDNEILYFVLTDGSTVKQDAPLYKNIKMSITDVNITCPVQKVKSVPVKTDIVGSVDDYRITVSPKNVTIQAEEEIANGINEIMTEPIEVNSSMSNTTVEVHLIAPEGVTLRDNKTVEVLIERKN